MKKCVDLMALGLRVRTVLICLGMMGQCVIGATLNVTKVEAKQRYPWNGMVDITVTLVGTEEDCSAANYLFYATNNATKTALTIRSVTPVGTISGSADSWTRRFVWNATADVGYAKFSAVELTVVPSFGVQLWENGPYWAECNVGATKPEEYGYYFWWGDTVGYKRNADNNGWVSVKDGSAFSFGSGNCSTFGKNNSQLQSEGYIDETGNLVAAHDAVTAHLGAPWRMPTDAEMQALISNCDATSTTRGGVYGRLVTGRGAYASRSIFLPAAGNGFDSRLSYAGSFGGYWPSTPNSDTSDYAWRLRFDSSNYYRSYIDRDVGQSVRPLRGFAQ